MTSGARDAVAVAGGARVDPITLAVVRGALETAQREMTLTMERTGRSSVLTVSRDFSNAIFDSTPASFQKGRPIRVNSSLTSHAMSFPSAGSASATASAEYPV